MEVVRILLDIVKILNNEEMTVIKRWHHEQEGDQRINMEPNTGKRQVEQ